MRTLHALLVFALLLGQGWMAWPASGGEMRIPPALLEIAAQDPTALIPVIIQKRAADTSLEEQVAQMGGRVTRDLSIINAFAAEIPARALSALAQSPAVYWISLDAPMVETNAPAPSTLTVTDAFTTTTYTNQDGNVAWASAWTEVGENDGPLAGDVRIVRFLGGAKQGLRIQNADKGVWRTVDLSNAADIMLHLDYRRKNLSTSDYLRIEVSVDGGTTWTEVGRLSGPATDHELQSATFDLSSYATPATQLRLLSGPTLTQRSKFYIDQIQITYTYTGGINDVPLLPDPEPVETVPWPPSPAIQRVMQDLQALYTFEEKAGTVVHDVSGVSPALDLAIRDPGNVSWLPDGGLSVQAPTVISSTEPATRIVQAVKASNELTVDAWILPVPPVRNEINLFFTLGPVGSPADFRSGTGNSKLMAQIRTSDNFMSGNNSSIQAFYTGSTTPLHVAITRASDGTFTLYLNGMAVSTLVNPGSDLAIWDDNSLLMLVNEYTLRRPWIGELHEVAVYSRALTGDEILQNFQAGPTRNQIDTTNLASTYVQAIGADQVWNVSPFLQGQDITVAVVDSGIAVHHDLNDETGNHSRILHKVFFSQSTTYIPDDYYGHGTHVAGTIGGNGEESNGTFIGVAPRVNLVDVQVMDDQGMGTMSEVVAGLQWVLENKDVYNIRIVNLSLNSSVAESYHLSPLDAAVEILWFNQIVVVVSAGNNGAGPDNGILYPPANDPFVIVVGAADDLGTPDISDDVLAPFSAFGITEAGFSKPDIIAPGTNIISLLASDDSNLALEHPDHRADLPYDSLYFRMSGTSMASAVAAGAVALLLQDEPDLTPDQVKYRLTATARPFNYGNGAGYLDIAAAIRGTTTESANVGVQVSQLLWTGSESITWAGGIWDSTNWNSTNWNSVNWSSVNWSSVNWNSVNWSH